MKRYIKDGIIKTRNQIVIRKDGMNTYNPTEEMILADGWVEYIIPEPTKEELQQTEIALEIRNAKRGLDGTDYKIIKCMEAFLCNEPLPYDIAALHAERDDLRLKINELEQMPINSVN